MSNLVLFTMTSVGKKKDNGDANKDDKGKKR